MLILKVSIWRIDINDARMQSYIEYTLQKPIIKTLKQFSTLFLTMQCFYQVVG